MQGSSRRAVLQSSVGLIAVLGGCAGRPESSGTTPSGTSTGASAGETNTTSKTETTEQTTTKPDPVSHEAIRWHAWTGETHERPTVVEDTVYTTGDEVYSLSTSDGSKRWSFKTDSPLRSGVTATKNEALFVSAKLGTVNYYDAVLHTVDTDGNRRWEYRADENKRAFPSALGIANGSALVGFGDDARSDTGHQVCSFDLSDGRERWVTPAGDPSNSTVQDGILYLETAGQVAAISTGDGTERWTFDPGGTRYGFDVSADLACATVSHEDGSERLYAAETTNGEVRWAKEMSLGVGGVAVTDNTVYVLDEKAILRALTPDGDVRWRCDLGAQEEYFSGSVTLSEDTVYASSHSVWAVDAQDGSRKWSFNADGGYHHPAILDDGVLVRSGENSNRLSALDSDGTVRWQFEGSKLTLPTVENDSIYVADDAGYLYALDF